MRTKKRNATVALLATLGCFATAFGAIGLYNASANTDTVSFDGAQIRVSEPSGIRFVANYSTDFAEEYLLETNGEIKTGVEIGMIITPAWVLTDAMENKGETDLIDYLCNKYGKEQSAFTTTFSSSQIVETEAGYTVRGAIVNIQDVNYSSEYQAVAYYSLDNGVSYVYGAESETRNIASVAEAALNNPEWMELNGEYEATLNAILAKSVYDVTYYNGADVFYTEKVAHGNTANYGETPAKENAVFVGWFETQEDAEIADAANAYDFATAVKAPVQLYAGYAYPKFNAPTGLNVSYKANTEVAIPNASFTFGSETVSADIAVSAPDGSAVVLVDGKFTPSKIGMYTITYSAMVAGTAQTETCTFAVIKNISYASWNNPNTDVDTNAAIPGGWGEGMLGVNLAAGDTITLTELADFTGKTLASNYFAYQISFDKMTKAEYEDRELTIRFTNPEDPTEYVEFRNVCDTDVSGQVYVYASYSKGLSNTWGQSNFGSDVAPGDYGLTNFTIKLGSDGMACQWYSAVATCANQIAFSKAIVTLSSSTGIHVAFSYLADARGWQK